jgi:hypothetical protein
VDWPSQRLPPDNLRSVAFGNGRFLALGQVGRDYTNYLSTNGWDWTGAPLPTNQGVYTFGFARDVFLLFDVRQRVFASSDGISWSLIGTNNGYRSAAVSYGHGYFVLTGPVTEYSCNARVWQSCSSPDAPYGNAMAFGNGTFVVAGLGKILQSDPIVRLESLTPGRLLVESPVPAHLQIQAATNLTLVSPWQPLDNLTVTNSPFVWDAAEPPSGPQQFHRGVLLQ